MRQQGGATAPARHRRFAPLVALSLLLGGAVAPAAAQTPPATLPAAQAQAQAPAAVSPAPSLLPAEFVPGAPHLETVAQGVVDLGGGVAWRVRELTLDPAGAVETGNFVFTLQRTGNSIVQDQQTGRRVRLEPGEASFAPTNDPTSRTALPGDPSVVWLFELTQPDVPPPAGRVLFTSPTVDYPGGTYDTELHRGILLPGEVSEIPAHTGPAFVMVTAGRVQASPAGGQPTQVGAGSGMLVDSTMSLRNTDQQPASFVVALVGDTVEGAEVAAPVQTAQQPTPAPPAQAPADQQAQAQPPVPPPADLQVAAPTPAPAPPANQQAQAQPPADQTQAQAQPADQSQAQAQPADQQVNPTDGDTDGDGLSDVDEANLGTDPLNKDYDADGLLDGAEVYQYGTDPLNNDTDGDGLLDGEEINTFGTSPSSADTDGDGLGDADEIYIYGTNPAAYDTDGDGIGDGEEVIVRGTNPLDPNSGP